MLQRILSNHFLQTLLLLVLLVGMSVLSFSHARWREQIRNFSFDQYNLLKPRVASDDIVVVDIDEASLAEVGQMPWPRDVMAKLVSNLADMGASVVVFDIVFPEPDRSSPHAFAAQFEKLEGFEDVNARLESLPDHDEQFGEAIKEAGNVVTAFSFTNEETDTTPRIKGIFRGKAIERFVKDLRGVSANLRSITKGAAGNGSFFVSTDTDGIIRRVPMLVAHRRPNSSIVSVYPSLSLEAIRVHDGERGGRVILGDERYAAMDQRRFGIEGIQLGRDGRFIPTTAQGEFIVYFAKSNKDWYIPAYQILDGTYDPAKIKDKIVLIGTSAVGLKDIRSTPLNSFVAGVEVHLNIIDQILQGTFLSRSIEAEGIEAVAVFAAGLCMIIVAPFVGAMAQGLIMLILVLGLLLIGWVGFSEYGLLIDVFYPSVSMAVMFMLSAVLAYVRTEQERKHVRGAFGQYISKDVLNELTDNPDRLSLGGEVRDLSVMFTDIRSFTKICEGLSPEEIINLMNDFLTPMSDLVMDNRGTIDKYIGDAMMAFWNAPLDDDQHHRNACLAALGMQAALEPINEEVERKAQKAGKEPVLLKVGIGINSGPCSVGNMGSRKRFAYSALGDAVNLASRLEGQTKAYGVHILVGEDTQKHVPDMALLEVDMVRVIGRSQPTRIFALLGDEVRAESPEFKAWKKAHDEMIKLYRAQDFRQALVMANQCQLLNNPELDKVYDIYVERIAAMIKTPPAEDWDGVFDAVSK